MPPKRGGKNEPADVPTGSVVVNPNEVAVLFFLGRVDVDVLPFPSCWVLALRLPMSYKLTVLGVAVNYASCVVRFVRHGGLLSVGTSAHCGWNFVVLLLFGSGGPNTAAGEG